MEGTPRPVPLRRCAGTDTSRTPSWLAPPLPSDRVSTDWIARWSHWGVRVIPGLCHDWLYHCCQTGWVLSRPPVSLRCVLCEHFQDSTMTRPTADTREVKYWVKPPASLSEVCRHFQDSAVAGPTTVIRQANYGMDPDSLTEVCAVWTPPRLHHGCPHHCHQTG